MKKFMDKIANIFFPKNLKCIFCGRDIPDFDNKPFCLQCEKADFFNNASSRCKRCDIPFLGVGEYCSFCKNQNRNFDRAFCPFLYQGKAKSVVVKLKGFNAKYLAMSMAKLMAENLQENSADFDVIIPVPLSKKSFKTRGYNQSLLLAIELGKIFQKPVLENILKKDKETKKQKKLSFKQRQENLKNAFIVENKKQIKDKNILLVDDIITTCATVNMCSQVLKKHCSQIFVSAFARRKID